MEKGKPTVNTISKKILAIIFILLIFFIGLGTSLRMMDGMDQVREQEGVQDTKAALDSLITDSFMNKTDWVSINGLFQRLLGVTIVRDEDKDVYKLSNGQIMYNLPERDMTKYAGYVADLDKALKEEDIELLYVQIPYKIKDDSYMPPGTHAPANENADQLVKLLREKGVDTLDLRD